MDLKFLNLLAKIHWGTDVVKNKTLLSSYISNIEEIPHDIQILIDVFTTDTPTIVTEYDFFEPLKDIKNFEMMAFASIINRAAPIYNERFRKIIYKCSNSYISMYHEILKDLIPEHFQSDDDIFSTVFKDVEIRKMFLINKNYREKYRTESIVESTATSLIKRYITKPMNPILLFDELKFLKEDNFNSHIIEYFNIQINTKYKHAPDKNMAEIHLLNLILCSEDITFEEVKERKELFRDIIREKWYYFSHGYSFRLTHYDFNIARKMAVLVVGMEDLTMDQISSKFKEAMKTLIFFLPNSLIDKSSNKKELLYSYNGVYQDWRNTNFGSSLLALSIDGIEKFIEKYKKEMNNNSSVNGDRMLEINLGDYSSEVFKYARGTSIRNAVIYRKLHLQRTSASSNTSMYDVYMDWIKVTTPDEFRLFIYKHGYGSIFINDIRMEMLDKDIIRKLVRYDIERSENEIDDIFIGKLLSIGVEEIEFIEVFLKYYKENDYDDKCLLKRYNMVPMTKHIVGL